MRADFIKALALNNNYFCNLTLNYSTIVPIMYAVHFVCYPWKTNPFSKKYVNAGKISRLRNLT